MRSILVNLFRLLNAVAEKVTECLRLTKDSIFVVLSYRASAKQNI